MACDDCNRDGHTADWYTITHTSHGKREVTVLCRVCYGRPITERLLAVASQLEARLRDLGARPLPGYTKKWP